MVLLALWLQEVWIAEKHEDLCFHYLFDVTLRNSFSGAIVFSVAKIFSERLGDWNLLIISVGTTFLRITYDHLFQDLVTSDKLVSRCES